MAFLVDILEHLNKWNVVFNNPLHMSYIQLYRLSNQKKVNLHIFLLWEEHVSSNAAL
jgi:hypothetical protein